MIYFRSLLSKRNPEIFLFQSVVHLITNARQNFETFEVSKTHKKKTYWRQLKTRLCLLSKQLMLTNVYKIMDSSLLGAKRFRNPRHKCAPRKPWANLTSGKKNNIAFSRSCSTSIIETNSKLICVVLEYS